MSRFQLDTTCSTAPVSPAPLASILFILPILWKDQVVVHVVMGIIMMAKRGIFACTALPQLSFHGESS